MAVSSEDQQWADDQFQELDNAELDAQYQSAEVPDEFAAIPDGSYQAAIDKAELTRSKSGKAMLKTTLKIVGPSNAGRLIWRYNLFETADNIKFLKADLARCGMTLDHLGDLRTRVSELNGIIVAVKLQTKGDRQQCYIQSLVSNSVEQGADSAPF